MAYVTPFNLGAQSMPYDVLTANPTLAGLKSRPSVSTNVGAEDLPDERTPPIDLTYEKKVMSATFRADGKGSSLRALFAFSDIQAPPAK
jgi:hypothetical protein